MRHPLLCPDTLSYVLVRDQPASVGDRLVDDLHQAAVRSLDDLGAGFMRIAQHVFTVSVDVAREGPGLASMFYHVPKRTTRPDNLWRQTIHFDVFGIANNQMPGRIEQQEALRHIVDGGVEPLLLEA